MSFDEKTLIHIRVHLPVTHSPNFKNSTKRLSASLQRVLYGYDVTTKYVAMPVTHSD